MADGTADGGGWFADVDPGDVDAAGEAIRDGEASEPRNWPQLAVDSGHTSDEAAYYDLLREATLATTRREVHERERADDQQLIHAIRALEDCRRVHNELAERVGEWAGSLDDDVTLEGDSMRRLAEREPSNPIQSRVVSLASRALALEEETRDLETFIEQSTPEVAPNLSALAGPELAARLVSLAGGLEELARQPSGTVQVLGAEDALFAHLQGGAPSPKHGIIHTHEYVRGTPSSDRGSAARALAGKLSIAARIDHYSGDYRPDLERELAERIERIRARDAP